MDSTTLMPETRSVMDEESPALLCLYEAKSSPILDVLKENATSSPRSSHW